MTAILLTLALLGYSRIVSAAYEECEHVTEGWYRGWHLLPINDTSSGIVIADLAPSSATISYYNNHFQEDNLTFNALCGSRNWEVRRASDFLQNNETIKEFNCLIYDEELEEIEKDRLCASDSSYCDEAVYLECLDKDKDDGTHWRLKGIGLYMIYDEIYLVEGKEGLLVAEFTRGRNEKVSGTVCDDNFNYNAADLACQYIGFEYAEDWGSSPENAQYIPNSVHDELNWDTVIDDVTCTGEEVNITDCRARIMDGHDCSRSENVWLKCQNNYTDWELTDAKLIKWDRETETMDEGDEGLILVWFTRQLRSTNESFSRFGTVCDDRFNDHAANLTCQYLGYDFARGWGSDPDNDVYLPTGILEQNQIGILVDDVYCNSTSSHIEECAARVLEGHDCEMNENLWLSCGHDGDEDGDGELENGAELKFGGADVSLNLTKFKKKWMFQ